MKLRYFSHSSFLITLDPGTKVSADQISADYILVSHGHGDHLGDAISIAERCNALCICENELATYLSAKGVRSHAMHIGGTRAFDFGKVKLTQALHSSVTPDKECIGTATGMILFVQDKIIYHTGDTGLFLDMKLIGELYAVDYLLAPIGDNFTMGIEDAVRACTFIKPKWVIPMHYNTFDAIKADPEEFKQKVETSGIRCRVLEFGQEIEL